MNYATIEEHASTKWGWEAAQRAGKDRPYANEWLFEAMKIHYGWATGYSMTRDAFDECAVTVAELPISGER